MIVLRKAKDALRALSGQWTLTGKIALSFILVSFLMTFVVGMASFFVSTEITARMNYRMSESSISNLSASVDRALQNVEDSVNSLYRFPSFNRPLETEAFGSDSNITLYNEAGSAISSISYTNPIIKRIFVWGRNGFRFSYFDDTAMVPQPPYDDFESCRSFFFADDHSMYMSAWHWKDKTLVERGYGIGFVKILYNRNDLEENGIITLELGEKEVKKLYQGYEGAHIVAGDGTVLSHSDGSLLGADISGMPVFREIRDRGTWSGSFRRQGKGSVIIFFTRLQTINAYLVVPMDYGSISKERGLLLLVMVALLLSCGLLSVLLARSISRGITRPVLRLKSVMEQVQRGGLDARFDADGGDEVNYLGRQFNAMLDEINRSIALMKKAEAAKGAAELKLLQSQINPHLLYNTLDSLLWYLDNGKVAEAVQVVSSLSGFFKTSLSKGRLMLPIRGELEHVRHYIRIQKLCRDQDLSLELDADPALLELQIPKLTFQPIVENAILHAFGGYRHDGVIRFSLATEEEGRLLRISIEDNGLGMDEEEVASWNRRIHEPPDGAGPGGFGLYNVERRIKCVFGERYSITMESELGVFTRVTLRVPAVRGNEAMDGDG